MVDARGTLTCVGLQMIQLYDLTACKHAYLKILTTETHGPRQRNSNFTPRELLA